MGKGGWRGLPAFEKAQPQGVSCRDCTLGSLEQAGTPSPTSLNN